MAEVEGGLYEYTFAVGTQMNDDVIDFAFYTKSDLSEMFSGKTTAERYLTYDSTLGSNHFNIGRGSASHADGHIYKRVLSRHLPDGSLWTAVVDVRGGLKGGTVYIREAEDPTGIKSLPDPLLKEREFRLRQGEAKKSHPLGEDLEEAGKWYDLGGRLADGGHRMPRGIYLRDGRKVLKQR